MKIEFCIESIEGAIAAEKWNANRIEICKDLNNDGLTPDMDFIDKCTSKFNGESFIMIRPKKESFCYTKEEVIQMKNDITNVFHLKVDGVVFGVLDSKNEIDISSNTLLINHAKMLGLKSTFHRAFDQVTDPFKSMEKLISLGFNSILTSGQKNKAIEGISLIEQLVIQSNDRIEIMAGSGIDHTNLLTIKNTGVHAVHFSIHNKDNHLINESKIEKIMVVIY
jgi:copper homeostasis protein